MATVPLVDSVDSTVPDGAPTSTLTRPISGPQRQLPVPQFSSRVSLPKTLISQKIPGGSAENKGVTLRVEMVKQVKVNCAVQESCESRLSPTARVSADNMNVASTSSSFQSPRQPDASVSLPQRPIPPSKIGLVLEKSAGLPQRKETSEPGRSGAIVAPTFGVQYTIRKGLPRQLPVKPTNQKDSTDDGRVDGRNSGTLPAATETPGVIKNRNGKEKDDKKTLNIATNIMRKTSNNETKIVSNTATKTTSMGTRTKILHVVPKTSNLMTKISNIGLQTSKLEEKTSNISKEVSNNNAKSSNTVAKPSNMVRKSVAAKATSDPSTLSRISKPKGSVNSSPSSSTSSSAMNHVTTKRPLHFQPTKTMIKQFREPFLSPKRPYVKLNSTPSEMISGKWTLEKPTGSLGKPVEIQNNAENINSNRAEDIGIVLLSKKRGLLSDVGKGSTSSSRRTSSSSIGGVSRGSTPAGKNRSSSGQDDQGIVQATVAMSYLHQPDVISNSVPREFPNKQLHLLERMCREFEKRANFFENKLNSRTTGFEAMTMVTKHFSERVEFLLNTVSDLRSRLVSSDAKCEVLSCQLNALISEIQSLKEEHEVQINGMTVTHQMEILAIQEKTEAFVRDVEERQQHLAKSADLKSKEMVEELKCQHAEELKVKSLEFSHQMADVESEHKLKIAELQRNQDSKLKELKAQLETVRCALTLKVEHLTSECNDLRNRNHLLSDPADSLCFDSGRILEAAEKRSEMLTQEIESLKVILDLRNEEVGRLRSQNVTQETQLQEAKRKINELELKLENSEALLDLKAGYERELSEKHATLLRRYSKESKVNKRLSMNNEELLWKLEQVAPATSPKPLRRSHSGPPTKSAPGTPLLARRSQPEMTWESFSEKTGSTPMDLEGSD